MYKHILVPVAFEKDRDSTAACDIAKALTAQGGRVTLLHVMEEVPSYAINYMPQGFVAESRRAVETELAQMSADLPGGTGAVIEGHSGRSILDYAAANDVDCIVIASHRPGMQDLLLGSTATQVVRHSKCAVHVIR